MAGSHPARCVPSGYHIWGLGQGHPTTQEGERRIFFSPALPSWLLYRARAEYVRKICTFSTGGPKKREDKPPPASSGVTSRKIARHGGQRTFHIHLRRILARAESPSFGTQVCLPYIPEIGISLSFPVTLHRTGTNVPYEIIEGGVVVRPTSRLLLCSRPPVTAFDE